MIAKISTGVYTSGMVKYNHDKTILDKNGIAEGELLGTNLIPKNDFETIVSTLIDYNKLNTDVTKSNIHISLNFHKDDVLDNDNIYKIAQDYLNELGYNNQPYAVYRHYDREHPHVHIVSSQINTDRKKINDSHIYYRSQAITRKLEEKYNITKALEKNTIFSKKDLHQAIYEHLEHGKHSHTAILKRVLSDVMDQKPTSHKQFENILESYQVKRIISEDSDLIKGHFFDLVPIDQLKNEKYDALSKGIKGSDLDPTFTYQSIDTQININSKQKEELQKGMMGRVYSVINPLKERNRISISDNPDKELYREKLTDFIYHLKKKGIELQVKRSQTGADPNTIYGLIFKDLKSNQSYSATDIKLKTKDFLKLIDDDQKNLSDKEKTAFMDEMRDTLPSASNSSGNKDDFNIFDMISEVIKNKSAAPTNGDDTPTKKSKKRKRGY